jgi:hypothetical protein
MTNNLGIWLAAIATLAIYSALFKDNPVLKLFEHIFVGMGASWSLIQGFQNFRTRAWTPLTTKGDYLLLVPVILGLLLYTRFFKQYSWVSRIPMSYLVGLGIGLSVRGAAESDLVRQIQASFTPLGSLDSILLFVGTLGTLLFFVFVSGKGFDWFRPVGMLGRWTIMLAFGAAFGNAVQGRISLLISRLQFLFSDWIYLIPK